MTLQLFPLEAKCNVNPDWQESPLGIIVKSIGRSVKANAGSVTQKIYPSLKQRTLIHIQTHPNHPENQGNPSYNWMTVLVVSDRWTLNCVLRK